MRVTTPAGRGLFGPPVGRLQSGAVEEREHGIPFPHEMVAQAPVGRRVRALPQHTVHPPLSTTYCTPLIPGSPPEPELDYIAVC